MKKKLDLIFFILGGAFILIGAVMLYKDPMFKKDDKPKEDTPIIKNDLYEKIVNTCWNNELLSEETDVPMEKKQICFDEDGTFTYKYTKSHNIVEDFEGYTKYEVKNNDIILISDNKNIEKRIINVSSINNEYMALKYDQKLVSFVYYCKL